MRGIAYRFRIRQTERQYGFDWLGRRKIGLRGMAYRLRSRLAKCTDESVSWCVVERNISDWQGGEIRRRDRYFDFAFADAETRFLGRRDVKVGRVVHCPDGSVEMVRWKGKFIWLHGGETSRQGRALRFRPRAAGCRDVFPWPMQCQGSWLVQCTAAVFAFQAKQKSHLLPPQG